MQMSATHGVLVHAEPESVALCPQCGDPLQVQKTLCRRGQTLTHGVFRVRETVRVCARGCSTGHEKKAFLHRAKTLAKLLLPRRSIGYDIMSFIGKQRYLAHRQREEIRHDLGQQYGVVLSTGEISKLERSFTIYLKALHDSKATAIQSAMSASGGYALHIDATCEAGRGMIFVGYCGWREWVLGAWKIPTERCDVILPRLQGIENSFGTPRAVMRDLGHAVTESAEALVGDRDIPIFACHLHFLKDIGKDLLSPAHDKLRELFRRQKLRARLANHARKLGRAIGTDIGKTPDVIRAWLAGEPHQELPGGEGGLAVIRALTQWVLDFAADGEGDGFPFDRPMLDLYHRSRRALRVVESLLLHPSTSKVANRALASLHTILIPARSEVPFAGLARIVETRARLFDELRETLRMTPKQKSASAEQALQTAELQSAETALKALELALKKRRPERGPARDIRDAIDVILAHIKRHGANLWGHAIAMPDGGTRLVARTNVLLEQLFGHSKRRERRRSGRKNLAQDLEHLPAEAFLALNLEKQDYLDVICDGKIENLPDAFAALDADNRSQSLPVRLKTSLVQEESDIVSVSLPKPDRNLVRTSEWQQRIHAAAKSRAPLRQAAEKRASNRRVTR